ncbi:hypothetical protein AQUSIP_23870 [Aquicella siphonis]|uniref:Uncharacterized protein n=1 Tax=Aquicella siphonis TaxID=254247 RepID=A0A5E4PJ69_9COXI|nr:hypothetical protein [Aquicella siphonis]VVC77060.1 hypothetical protein AQUSIP_23870 [Aquicella siphonis]
MQSRIAQQYPGEVTEPVTDKKRFFILLGYALVTGAIIILLLMGESGSYASQLKDSRGFPITQTPGSSFGMPPVNTLSPIGAPLVTLPPVISQPGQTIKANSHASPYRHSNALFFYFNADGYPYLATPTEDDFFYYSSMTGYAAGGNAPDPENSTFAPPYGKWVAASNGFVPDKAFVYQAEDPVPTFYCRGQYRYRIFYGVLTPNAGCFIEDQSAIIRLNDYEVLISKY